MNSFAKYLMLLALLMVSAVGVQAQVTIGGSVYGGGRMAPVDGGTKVAMSQGTVEGSVYGANDISGCVGDTAIVVVTGGNVNHNVFGGANGAYGCNSVTTYKYTTDFGELDFSVVGMAIPTVNCTKVTINGAQVKVYGSVYGGGNMAYIGNGSPTRGINDFKFKNRSANIRQGSAVVNLYSGQILGTAGSEGNLFAGGNMASVYGSATLNINNNVGGSNRTLVINGSVYGGNDKFGAIASNGTGVVGHASDGTNITANMCYVKIVGSPTIGNVYGGGNGDYLYDGTEDFPMCFDAAALAANLPTQQHSFVDINTNGGYIGNAFAGGNGVSVTSSATILLNSTGSGTGSEGNHVGNIFGGNNKVDMAVVPTIKLTSGRADAVYGGGNMGGITGTKTYNGKQISTLITLNSPNVSIGDLYGGSNVTGSIAASTYIDLTQGTVRRNVYGGANGEYGCNDEAVYTTNVVEPAVAGMAIPTANATYVRVNGATVNGSIYGGGNRAPIGSALVSGTTEVALESGNVGSVYGGGNMAMVYGHADIYTTPTSTITINRLFGGNDKSGNVTGESRTGIALDGTTALSVENAAAYVKIQGQPHITTLFGGGNGDYTAEEYAVFGCNVTPPNEQSSFVDLNLNTGGSVGTSYGGGNAASIAMSTVTVVDGQGSMGTIYGGCRASDVGISSTVELKSGVVGSVFGGNDVAGSIGSTVINLNGNVTAENLYGGGNGKYYYQNGNAYEYANHSQLVKANVSVAPIVGETTINLDNGVVNQNVYGGGMAGDVQNTNVDVNAGAEVHGTIFGGGCGIVENAGLCIPHVGNVNGSANVMVNDLHANTPRIFAGGRSGDVANANITVKETLTKKIGALYGGCQASNLTGETRIIIGTQGTENSTIVIDTVYGGNDFSGLTQRTNLTINSGTFKHVFGAGNGDYDYNSFRGVANVCDTIPYSMDVLVTINGGMFNNTIYGGGNRGLVGHKDIRWDNYPEGTSRENLYGNIRMDVHGGYFVNHIFLGARGSMTRRKLHFGFDKFNQNPRYLAGNGKIPGVDSVTVLAYAYKQFNMDGGYVDFSVYGGSEAVDDGFPYECWDSDPTKTTMRPTTVLNIVGGTVRNRVYGAGYRGNVYGSVYVNIGEQAINDCPVWTRQYGRQGSGLGTVNFLSKKEFAANLDKSDLYIGSSIYNGSDWGEAGEAQFFDQRGFFGGLGLIYIDGDGYKTTLASGGTKPIMELTGSIFGSGTSTNYSDINSRIIFKNYGDYTCPSPSRQLRSIQRTNRLYLDNVKISLLGDNNAYISFTTQQYTLAIIDTVIMHESNLLDLHAPAEYVGMMRSEDTYGNLYTNASLFNESQRCDPHSNPNVCELLYGDILSMNVFLLRGGTYIDVMPFIDANADHVEDNGDGIPGNDHDYGRVHGYFYTQVNDNSLSYIYGGLQEPTPGGFVSPCSGNNTHCTDSIAGVYDIDFTITPQGQIPPYRTWGFGFDHGDRRRHITLVAHANPDKVVENSYIDPADKNWAYTTGTLTLPPSEEGHYYTIHSVTLSNVGAGEIKLTESAYDEKNNNWWSPFTGVGTTEQDARNAMVADPQSSTFGLMFRMGNFFNNSESATISHRPDGFEHSNICTRTVVSGNTTLTNLGGFLSSPISNSQVGVLPTIDFTLSYNTNLKSTGLYDLNFTMYEYDDAGAFVGPVEVTVSVITIITDFDTLSAPVMAMYNEGTYNEYIRKVVIPASYIQRNLYLTGVEWQPAHDEDKNANGRFQIQPIDRTIQNYRQFSIAVEPTQEALTGSTSNNLGWYRLYDEATYMDAYNLAYSSGTNPKWNANRILADTSNLEDVVANALRVGILDGRSEAAIDITLNFNGNFMYENIDTLGNVLLYFTYIDTRDNTTHGNFVVNIKLRTRITGDTIYMAEKPTYITYADGTISTEAGLTGHGGMVTQISRYDTDDLGLPNSDYKKNDPFRYLATFDRAAKVYDEGDIICILDTIHVNNPEKAVTLMGSDYNRIWITRYSGSHFRWPGEDHAYLGPLVKVSNGARLTFANVRIDGSGCGYVAKGVPDAGAARCSRENDYGQEGDYAIINGMRYNYHTADRNVLYSEAPLIWVEDNSRVSLLSNVEMVNNYNKLQGNDFAANTYYGGAVGMYNTAAGTPSVVLGTRLSINDNIVINYDNGCIATNPKNYGGAVYSNGGKLVLGNGRDNNTMRVDGNFYMPVAAMSGNARNQYINPTQLNVYQTDGSITHRDVYRIKRNSPLFKKSNVYLSRTSRYPSETNDSLRITYDNPARTSAISVVNQLHPTARIGISKWFPGYMGRDAFPRDTVTIVDYSETTSLAAQNDFANGVFLDDSITYRDYNCDSIVEDNVSMRYSTKLNHYCIYLHRCATFREAELPIVYEMNPDVVCPGDGDVLHYYVKGGTANFTYRWFNEVSPNNYQEIPNSQSITDTRDGAYTLLHFDLAPNETEHLYHLKATVEDAGGCSVERKVDVVVKLAGSDMEGASANTTSIAGGRYENGHFYSNYLATWLGKSVGTPFDIPSVTNYLPSEPNATMHALRLFTYYKLDWDVLPVGKGTIAAQQEGVTVTPTTKFCPGDVVDLTVTPVSGYELVMWDADPSASTTLNYVIQNADDHVTAHLAPNDYWYRTVTSDPGESGYSVDYHGNVTIKNAQGLAWFISTVNGLNGQNPENFIFDTITIKAGTYNMDAHKWTPLGNARNPFRGYIQAEEGAIINGIVVSEDQLQHVGFFGVTDSARIHDLNLTNGYVRGYAYGGGLVGMAGDSTIITGANLSGAYISAANAVGGLVGKSENALIYGNDVNVHLVGNSLYGGGLAGHATRTRTSTPSSTRPGDTPVSQDNNSNSVSTNGSRLSALYLGGVFGYSQGMENPTRGKAGRGSKIGDENSGHIQINNNYVHLAATDNSLYVGGLVGYATTTDMQNNYAYGSIKSLSANGGLMGRVGSNVNVSNCYYAEGSAATPFGAGSVASSEGVTTFQGAANQVQMTDSVEGVNNLTRALNLWVREHGTNYRTWRSDFEDVNGGYPIFGNPDLIPIYDTLSQVVCDSLFMGGHTFTLSGNYNINVPDSINFVDSNLVLILTVNHSQSLSVEDSVVLGNGYSGNGFVLSSEELQELVGDLPNGEVRVLQFVDSLFTAQGCDSTITLTLTISGKGEGISNGHTLANVSVYPNPTTSKVTVSADGLLGVEVYDALSRRTHEVKATTNTIEVDLTTAATGTYYLRICTTTGITVQKVVKQ